MHGARLVVTAVLPLLLIVAGSARPAPASADLIWCWDDPTLVVNGSAVHLRVGVPAGARKVSTASLTVVVPANVKAHLSGAGARCFRRA
jgi:hypothetical protein